MKIMKTVGRILVMAVCSALLFAACKKDKSENTLTPKEQLLINDWSIDALTMKKINTPAEDSSIIKECVSKSKVNFQINRKFQITDTNKNCDSTLLPFDSGNWQLSPNAEQLVLKGKRNIVWQIQTLNSDQIKATFRDSLSPQHNFVKTIVLKK